ncbi:MAG: AsmA family protein [Gammaproteobacteria bacterium]|jgi:AsmA protein
MIKTFLKIASVFVALFVATFAGFVYFFDANDYKQEIAGVAEVVTGRKISIAGDLDVSVNYPWLTIKVNAISVDNPDGFARKLFATIDTFDISLKIIPLLLNRLDIDRLVLHKLEADLVRKQSGENNWAGIIDEPGFGFSGLSIGSIELKDSSITWSDLATGKQYKLSQMSAISGAVSEGQPLPLEVKAFVKSKKPLWQAGVNVKSKLEFNESTAVFNADDMKLAAKFLLPDSSIGKASFVMAADSTFDLESSSIKLNNARIGTLGLNMSGTFEINNLFTDPVVQGLLRISTFDVATLAERIKIDVPPFANEDVLTGITLATSLKTDSDSVYLDDIVAETDESRLTGYIHITDMEKAVIRYGLKIDRLQLSDYRFANHPAPGNKAHMALNLIRNADMAGVLDVESLLIDDTELSGFHVASNIQNGILNADPIAALVDNNEVNAALSFDAHDVSSSVLVAKVTNADANVIINPVLTAVAGDEAPALVGMVDVDANLKASGDDWASLKQSAQGLIKLDMDEVIVEGFDFDRAARRVVNNYSERYDFRASKTFMSTFLADSITEFEGLHTTFNVQQGKLLNSDLKLVSDKVTVTGSGSIDFINGDVDYRHVIDMHVESTANLRDKLRDHPMEYDVQGLFGGLAYSFDTDRYDLLVGRMLIQEAKARQYRQINQQKKTNSRNSWTNAISTK